jgi:hypothetical protein
MKLFRNPGLMIAVFWCAAMVIAPIAAAAGAGQSSGQGIDQPPGSQGINPGQVDQGNNLMQQGQGTGFGNDQNTAGPGQGNRPPGMDKGNGTESGDRSFFADNGNMTPPPEMPSWDPANSTAFNKTAGHGHRAGNMTGVNMTDIPPPVDRYPANMTAINQTPHGYGDENQTYASPPQQGSGDAGGQQWNVNQQAQSQKNSGKSLIDELIAWLKAHGVS